MWPMCPARSNGYGLGMHDPYEVLQVHRRAEPEVIRAAYRALARKYHPDFGGEPGRMIAITEAWAVLGNAERRAAYDAHAVTSQNRRSTDRKAPPASAAPAGNADRRGPNRSQSGSVIDFGRYAGWTVGSLADHDPDYLQWLARTPIGRRLTVEIDAALAQRESESAARRPPQSPARRRRSITRPWAASGPGTG
jgi:curved DNA-binding protein CbpA